VLAVNKGQIFRFLTKPCPADQLKLAIEAAVSQHRVINAERAVLQETLSFWESAYQRRAAGRSLDLHGERVHII
jgi:hypothetical protein